MASKAALFGTLRAIHLYVGVLIAPALLFFAVTGALQTFGLHENSRDSDYRAPRWAMVLGQIHKKQTAIMPERRPFPPPATASAPPANGTPGNDARRPAKRAPDSFTPGTGGAGAATSAAPAHNPLPLKLFFLLVSVGLLISTVTGVYMAFLYKRNKALILGLLAAGCVVPVVLLFV